MNTFLAIVFFLACFYYPAVSANQDRKIVCLLSGPRSLSTVFLRMMESRGDFAVYHEPLTPIITKKYLPEASKEWYIYDTFASYQDWEEDLLVRTSTQNVFIKELSFAFHKHLLNAEKIIKNPSIQFIILVRNPHHIAISLYKKLPTTLEQEKLNEVIGLKHLYEEYELIKKYNPNNIKILFANQLYTNTRITNISLCNFVGIPFLEESLSWESYKPGFDAFHKWHDSKNHEVTNYWHGDAMKSTKINTPTKYEVDKNNVPTFSEIKDPQARESFKKAYLDNLIYYKLFLKAKEDFLVEEQINMQPSNSK